MKRRCNVQREQLYFFFYVIVGIWEIYLNELEKVPEGRSQESTASFPTRSLDGLFEMFDTLRLSWKKYFVRNHDKKASRKIRIASNSLEKDQSEL